MNILLVRPDGIGDQVLCLPVASALRRLIPDATISFLSSEYAAPVLAHHPDIDEVLTITGRERLRELLRVFGGEDVALFLKPFRRLMLAAWLARVPVRVATGYRWYSLLANRRVYQHRRDFSRHEAEYNLGLLDGLHFEPGPFIPPMLKTTEEERRWAQEQLRAVPTPRVVLHPGGFAARRWNPEHYRQLALRLAQEGCGVLFTGSQAERDRFSQETEGPPSRPGVFDLMGSLAVRQLMAVIEESDVVVSGATGPAHLAAALGVLTVSLFDPRRNNLPIRWKPLGRGAVLRPHVPTCEKCIYEACPYWDCLDRITVQDVVIRIREALSLPVPIQIVHI